MDINHNRMTQSQNLECNLEEVKSSNPEGHIFAEAAEMTSITRALEHITCSAPGNQLVSATDRFPPCFLAIGSIRSNFQQPLLCHGNCERPCH